MNFAAVLFLVLLGISDKRLIIKILLIVFTVLFAIVYVYLCVMSLVFSSSPYVPDMSSGFYIMSSVSILALVFSYVVQFKKLKK